MKKILALVLALCMLCGMAAAEGAQTPENTPLHFAFWADTQAGYEWTCEYDDNGVLVAPMEETVPGEGGSMCEYYFGVGKPGTAEIIFNYGVNWDVTVPERTVICTVHVDEGGNASVRWAECYSDDRIVEIKLPSNPTTGWAWTYQGENEEMVNMISENYAPHDPALEGAGGTASYQFQVNQPGETVLMFNYSNLWEPTAPAQASYAVIITANESMEISMTIAE